MSESLTVISIIFYASVLKLVALPAVMLKLTLATDVSAARIIPLAASCLYVKSTLLLPLCNVIVFPLIAFSKNLDTTLSGISPGPYTPLGLIIL